MELARHLTKIVLRLYIFFGVSKAGCAFVYTNALLIRLRLNVEAMNTKKNKTGKTMVIPIRITPAEKNRLLDLAQAHGLSLSEYMRQAGLIHEITSRTEVETVLQLAKINVDQARLGNLLKLAIDQDNTREVEQLIADIRQTQQQLKDAVNRV